ncbi:MAG: hypothetical protein E7382_01165 [Clostridiales bacterium]|nr:hypothetical protein [Clostridiales bacterium]
MKKLLAVLISIFVLAMCGLTLTACNGDQATLDYVTFTSQTFLYDGLEKSIEVAGVPEGATVIYTPTNKHTEVGDYEITATVTLGDDQSRTLKATLSIKTSDKVYTAEQINALISSLNQALDNAKTETETLIGQIETEYTTKINALIEELNADKTALEALEKEYKDKVAELEATASANKTELENKLASDKAELNADIEALEKEYKDKVAELEATASANKTELENKLASDKAELNADIEALEKEYKDKVAELEATASANKTELENKLASDKAELNANIEALEKAYLDKVAELEATASANKTELENKLASDKAELNADIEALEKEYKDKVAEIEATASANKTELENKLASDKAELNANIEALEKEYKDKVAELEATASANKTELENKLAQDKAELNANIDALENKIADAKAEMDRKIGDLAKAVTSIENQIKELEEKLKPGHVHEYGDWVIDEKSNCEERGVKHRQCVDCKWVEIAFIEREHSFEDGECTMCGEFEFFEIGAGDSVGYNLEDIFQILEEFGVSPETYLRAEVTSVYQKRGMLSAEFVFEGKEYSFSFGDIRESFVVSGGCTRNILSANTRMIADRVFFEVILEDGTKVDAGTFISSIYDDETRKMIDKVAMNKQNELLIFYQDNTVLKCGTFADDNFMIDDSLLIYEKLPYENAYGVCGMYNSSITHIAIPTTHRGLPVISISELAFVNQENLVSVEIPSCITRIEQDAFYNCINLETITFEEGSSLESIGSYAFYNCTSLTKIEIPDSVKKIGNYAFYGCSSLESAVLSDNLTSIDSYTFNRCSSLSSIEIPRSVTKIGVSAFEYCTSLTSMVIPTNVTRIDDYAFFGCVELSIICCEAENKPNNWALWWYAGCDAEVYWAGEWQYVDGEPTEKFTEGLVFTLNAEGTEYSVTDYKGHIDDVVIPATYKGLPVTSIGAGAFQGYITLTSVVIPQGITSIGDYAFGECNLLESVIIPASVTSMGEGLFFAHYNGLKIYCELESCPNGWHDNWALYHTDDYDAKPNNLYHTVYWAGQWEYVDGVPTVIS